MRHCNHCNQDKPPEAFNKTNSQCRECINKMRREEYWGDPETSRLRLREEYKRSPRWKGRFPNGYKQGDE